MSEAIKCKVCQVEIRHGQNLIAKSWEKYLDACLETAPYQPSEAEIEIWRACFYAGCLSTYTLAFAAMDDDRVRAQPAERQLDLMFQIAKELEGEMIHTAREAVKGIDRKKLEAQETESKQVM
jgi:hypothetical protein